MAIRLDTVCVQGCNHFGPCNVDDAAARRVGIVVRADDSGVETHDRRGLHQVEGLALGHVADLRDIQQYDVAQFRGGAPVRTGWSNVTGSDDGDFRATHGSFL